MDEERPRESEMFGLGIVEEDEEEEDMLLALYMGGEEPEPIGELICGIGNATILPSALPLMTLVDVRCNEQMKDVWPLRRARHCLYQSIVFPSAMHDMVGGNEGDIEHTQLLRPIT